MVRSLKKRRRSYNKKKLFKGKRLFFRFGSGSGDNDIYEIGSSINGIEIKLDRIYGKLPEFNF